MATVASAQRVTEKERKLWQVFERRHFESGIAVDNASSKDVLRLLDVPAVFERLGLPLPDGHERMLHALADNRLVAPSAAGNWDITNLGAILFARRLSDLNFGRKAVRLIIYAGPGRIQTVQEFPEPRGYALALDATMERLAGVLPAREILEGARQRARPDFPEPALRELIANALIHQDFSISGAGPLVEVFDGRVEITNPGDPLVPTTRFLDTAPRSRNDALASMMRRLNLCEERGSGIDKVMLHVELNHLPAPSFQLPPGATRVVLFGPRPLSGMTRAERVDVCYWHAALRYLQHDALTNTSLRERFGMADDARSLISRYIREAVEDEKIRPADPAASPKQMRYVPWWA
jgi:ATP-dependent DNA helicase RecG